LAALEAGQARAKRMAEITTHLDTLGDDDLDRRLRQYQRASGRVAAERGGICAELGMAAILREPTGACALSSSS